MSLSTTPPVDGPRLKYRTNRLFRIGGAILVLLNELDVWPNETSDPSRLFSVVCGACQNELLYSFMQMLGYSDREKYKETFGSVNGTYNLSENSTGHVYIMVVCNVCVVTHMNKCKDSETETQEFMRMYTQIQEDPDMPRSMKPTSYAKRFMFMMRPTERIVDMDDFSKTYRWIYE